MPVIEEEVGIRIDLLGGTLDLWPINFIIPNVLTLNAALKLSARVEIELWEHSKIEIHSKDYERTSSLSLESRERWLQDKDVQKELALVAELLDVVSERGLRGAKLSLKSSSPAGAGLGGSSAMAIALTGAINRGWELGWSKATVLRYARATEAKVLAAGPAGYQDYYPALYGGVLALRPCRQSEVSVEQLYSPELALFLRDHITLVYSGKSRFSGGENWQIYKRFFDGDTSIQKGLAGIAALASQAYAAIRAGKLLQLLPLIAQEGKLRGELFSGMVPKSVASALASAQKLGRGLIGYKMCGAGGGGCFLVLHQQHLKHKISRHFLELGMEVLPA